MEFSLGEFFCGPGGIALGAMSVSIVNNNEVYKITPVWASDYDLDTCRTYSKNIHQLDFEQDDMVFHSDVRDLDIEGLPPSDGFAFGFPCNDFSIVGESKGLDGCYGPLYSYGVSYLKVHQPQWFVAENVGGLSSSNEGQAFKKILSDLKKSGYKLYPHLYKFHEYGVPQKRHRIIIVGIRNDIDLEFRIPAPTHINNYVTSFEALTIPPITEDLAHNEYTKQSSQVVERLRFIRPGENAWSENIPEHLRLNVKGARLSNIYKRLHPDEPAYTVTGSGGGGTHMYHWEEHRALTNRERARLQSFPDSYIFTGGRGSVRKQIGMAVPPKGIEVIFEALMKTFARMEYPSISSNLRV